MRAEDAMELRDLRDEVKRLRADIKTYEACEKADHEEVERLRADLRDYKDAAGAEAELADEFKAEVERLKAALRSIEDLGEGISWNIARQALEEE
jgi:predicted  nucleic acid-binding Zn-ribbon protein